MHTIVARKVYLFILISTLLPTRLYSANALAPLASVSEKEGKAAFQRLTSGRLWQKDPLNLNYCFFLNASERRYVVLWMARNHGQDYLPDGIDILMASYLTSDQYYTKDQFERLKEGPKTIKASLFGTFYINTERLSPFLYNKINFSAEGTRGLDQVIVYSYRMDDVLEYLLYGRELQQSCWRILFWSCSYKSSQNLVVRTYEEVIMEGWEDKHFVYLEDLLKRYTKHNAIFQEEILYNEHFREAMAFYMEPYHDAWVAPRYPSSNAALTIS